MVNVIKMKNKSLGYHCDRCGIVGKVVFSDNGGFLCENHAIEKFGQEIVTNAKFEDD